MLFYVTIQLNLNFTQACRYTHVLACLMHTKLQGLACAHTVALDSGEIMNTRNI